MVVPLLQYKSKLSFKFLHVAVFMAHLSLYIHWGAIFSLPMGITQHPFISHCFYFQYVRRLSCCDNLPPIVFYATVQSQSASKTVTSCRKCYFRPVSPRNDLNMTLAWPWDCTPIKKKIKQCQPMGRVWGSPPAIGVEAYVPNFFTLPDLWPIWAYIFTGAP